MRLATLIAADGVLPLGLDFIDKAVAMLDRTGAAQLAENERFQRLRGLIPGDKIINQQKFMEDALESVKDWVGSFIA